MINPINDAIQIVWGAKSFMCDISLGQLARVEGELDIAIVYPAAKMLWQKPEAYQRGVLLYAMLKPHGISLDDCMEVVVGERREYFLVKLQKATDRLLPQLRAIWGVTEEAPADPLAESSGGPSSGQTLESTLESQSQSSGA